MKTIGKITCSIIAVSAVIMLAACSSGEFSHKKLVGFCRKHGCEICDDLEKYSSDSSHLMRSDNEGGYYITGTEDIAEALYDRQINYFQDFRSYDVTEATIYTYQTSDSFSRGYLFTFEDLEDAEDFFGKYCEEHCEDGTTGIEKDYTYTVYHHSLNNGRAVKAGVYLKGNNVLIIWATNRNFDIIEDFCKTFRVIPPAGEE